MPAWFNRMLCYLVFSCVNMNIMTKSLNMPCMKIQIETIKFVYKNTSFIKLHYYHIGGPSSCYGIYFSCCWKSYLFLRTFHYLVMCDLQEYFDCVHTCDVLVLILKKHGHWVNKVRDWIARVWSMVGLLHVKLLVKSDSWIYGVLPSCPYADSLCSVLAWGGFTMLVLQHHIPKVFSDTDRSLGGQLCQVLLHCLCK